jgi:hypothetical protein
MKDDKLKERFSDASEDSTASTFTDASSFTAGNIENTSLYDTQSIRVVARVRPLSIKELNEQSEETVKAFENAKMIQIEKSREFYFDSVFGPSTTQKHVYEQTAGDLIRNNLFRGFNVTVLACTLLSSLCLSMRCF